MDEGLYPRSTEYFVPGADEEVKREQDREAEETAVKRELVILKQVLDRWSERIDMYNSLDGIPEGITNDKDKFVAHAAGNKRAVAILREERDWLNSLIESITNPD